MSSDLVKSNLNRRLRQSHRKTRRMLQSCMSHLLVFFFQRFLMGVRQATRIQLFNTHPLAPTFRGSDLLRPQQAGIWIFLKLSRSIGNTQLLGTFRKNGMEAGFHANHPSIHVTIPLNLLQLPVRRRRAYPHLTEEKMEAQEFSL